VRLKQRLDALEQQILNQKPNENKQNHEKENDSPIGRTGFAGAFDT
jgi:hypothetical protein